VALTAVDKALLQRCLNHEPGAWNDFVDQYSGLIYHIIHYTTHVRGTTLRPEDVEDLAAEIMLQIVAKDYAILRQFRGQSSLAAYLTVIARRICVNQLSEQAARREVKPKDDRALDEIEADEPPKVEGGLESLEQVQMILRKLPNRERQVVRLFYLEGRSYEEISTELNIPVNSIGPVLTRARAKMREMSKGAAVKQRRPE
jgi:RNA polymerase sigma-70 factor (ECF subfamily)